MQHGLSLSQEDSSECKEQVRMCQESQKLLPTSPSTGAALVDCALKASCPCKWPQESQRPFFQFHWVLLEEGV